MTWFEQNFIEECKPALNRNSGTGGGGGSSVDEVYILKANESIENAPANADIVIDPSGEEEVTNIVDEVLAALPTWTGGSY